MRYGSIKVTQMPPVHAANLAANSGNTAYAIDVIFSKTTQIVYSFVLNDLYNPRSSRYGHLRESRAVCNVQGIHN